MLSALFIIALTLVWFRCPNCVGEGVSDLYNVTNWCRIGAESGHCRIEPSNWNIFRKSNKHLMCMFPSWGTNRNSFCDGQVVELNVENEWQNLLFALHNNYRNKWANGEWRGQREAGFEKAANMRLLTYDYALHQLAKQHVRNCYLKKETCMVLDRFQYDQNIVYACQQQRIRMPQRVKKNLYRRFEVDKVFDDWANQYKRVPRNGRNNENVKITILSANIHHIGCAMSAFRVRNSTGLFACSMLVCNYGPVLDEPLYTKGDPGTDCPNGTSANVSEIYPYLCSPVKPQLVSSAANNKIHYGVLAILNYFLFWI